MDDNLIYGLIYSEFDQKLGPRPKFVHPRTLNTELVQDVSDFSLRLDYPQDNPTKSLAILPIPGHDLKSLVRVIKWVDPGLRGYQGDSTLNLLFKEKDDVVFYKYIRDMEEKFKKIADHITILKEKKASIQKIEESLLNFHEELKLFLTEMRESEVGSSAEEFPQTNGNGEEKKKFKVIVCGDSEVGKTSIVLRFTDKAFRRTYIPTLGVNISQKMVISQDVEIRLVIWDIAGQSKFSKMRKHFYEGSNAQILVFDLTRPETLKSLNDWYKDIKMNLKTELKGIILANKSDLKNSRSVSKEEMMALSDALHFKVYETSALTGENIHEAFLKIAAKLQQ